MKLEWRVEFASENACARGDLADHIVISRGFKSGLKAARREKVTPMRLVIYASAAIYEAFRGLSRAPVAGQQTRNDAFRTSFSFAYFSPPSSSSPLLEIDLRYDRHGKVFVFLIFKF